MRRSVLKEYANKLATDAEKQPFTHWANEVFPITYEVFLDAEPIQVEICKLESKNDYMHLVFWVSGLGLSNWFPVVADIILRNPYPDQM